MDYLVFAVSVVFFAGIAVFVSNALDALKKTERRQKKQAEKGGLERK